MTRGFLPNTDSGLLQWAVGFSQHLSASPELYGISAAQAAGLALLLQAYQAALQASTDGKTRGLATVLAKNTARDALKSQARVLGRLIDAQVDLTDQQRQALGLTLRKQRSPIPAPQAWPELDIVSVRGPTVTIRLRDAANNRHTFPAGVAAANVYSFVGENLPSDPSQWILMGSTTRAKAAFDLGPDATPGSQVWITACWLNPRAQPGPIAHPRQTYVQFGGGMRLAA